MNSISKIIAVGSIMIGVMGVGYSAQCHFKVPTVSTDICKTDLKMNRKVTDNPFFMKNPNNSCNMSFSMPQLPDLNLDNPLSYIKNMDLCKPLKALTGDQVISSIKSILG